MSRNHPVDFSTPSKPTAHVFSRVSTALASIAPNPALEHKSNALKLCVRVFSNRDLLVGKPTVSCREISPSTFFTSPSPSVHVFFSPHSHDPNINRKETLPSKKASWNVAFPAQELLHKIYFSECPNGSLHYHQKYYRGTIVGINRSGHDNHSTTPLQISEDRETVALSNWQSPYISHVKLEHTPHVTMHFLCEGGM